MNNRENIYAFADDSVPGRDESIEESETDESVEQPEYSAHANNAKNKSKECTNDITSTIRNKSRNTVANHTTPTAFQNVHTWNCGVI